MANSFDELVKRTTTKRTRAKAAKRTKELLGELLLSECRHMAGKSQREVADVLGGDSKHPGRDLGRARSSASHSPNTSLPVSVR